MLDNNALVAAATPVFFALIGLEWWLARRRQRPAYQLADSLTSMACGIWTVTLEVFTKSAMLLAYGWLFAHAAPWPSAPDAAWTWIWSFFALDFVYYWAHRWSHEINLLWAGHSPHHQSEQFNLSTALRQGAFQDLTHAPLFMLLALLGCPPGVFIVQLTLSKFYQFWIHTEAIKRMPRWFEAVFNTPSHHRVHHARNARYLDANYAGILIIWDRLFGTFIPETDEEPCRYGTVKNLGNFNLLHNVFHEWVGIGRDVAASKSPREVLGYVFGPPGWSPDGSRDTSHTLKAKWRARVEAEKAPPP